MREADAATAITRIREEALDAELAGTAGPARLLFARRLHLFVSLQSFRCIEDGFEDPGQCDRPTW